MGIGKRSVIASMRVVKGGSLENHLAGKHFAFKLPYPSADLLYGRKKKLLAFIASTLWLSRANKLDT